MPWSPRSRFLNRSLKLCPTLKTPCGHLKWWFASLLFQCLACLHQAQRNFQRRMCFGWGIHPGGPREAGMAPPFFGASSSLCGGMGSSLSSLGLLCDSWTMRMRGKGLGTGQIIIICSKIQECSRKKRPESQWVSSNGNGWNFHNALKEWKTQNKM